MSKTVRLKRGTTAQVNAYTGPEGELIIDTQRKVPVVQDGVTAGGIAGATLAGLQAATQQATENIRGTVEIATAVEAAEYLSDLVALTPAKIRSALNAPGNPPIYACRAWVNFDGNTGTIRAAGNVMGVVRSAVGTYTINFSTAMLDTNYTVSGSSDSTGNACIKPQSFSLSSVVIGNRGQTGGGSNVAVDNDFITVIIHR